MTAPADLAVPVRRPAAVAPDAGVPARIAAIATHLPDGVLTNDQLAATFPDWPAAKILAKTGIRERRIARPDETAGDLAAAAAATLFTNGAIATDEVDFLILCTQAPDHILPTTACLLQDRLGLRTSIGALDINLGCSGYVYGLSLAAALIAAGMAQTLLLLTADTYSKYIHDLDKSVRTLFGDGATATLVRADSASARIGPFVFGTDGGGGKDLIVPAGGFRLPRSTDTARVAADRTGNARAADHLFMDGGNVLAFTLREVPAAIGALLAKTGTTIDDYDHVVFHQANKFMLDTLQRKLGLPDAQVPRLYEHVGNTVSSTIPFVLEEQMRHGRCSAGTRSMLVGFGVGLSWAAASITF